MRLSARLALVLTLALAGCTATQPPAPPPQAARPAPESGICRIGPDDGPPSVPAPQRVAERGIGGTGISTEEGGDRGIGGTGIVGVITGFASICVNGLEVEYDPALFRPPPEAYAPPVGLRVGQLVVIEAGGAPDSLQARSVTVRYEVSGPVEQLRPGQGLRVAGQEVRYAPAMTGGQDWKTGDWVAISGLQQPDGRILATRIDRRAPGMVRIHGVLQRDGTGLRLGALHLTPALASGLRAGQPIVATGRQVGGAVLLDSTGPDLLLTDPRKLFGPGTDRLVVESYVTFSGEWLGVGDFRVSHAGIGGGGMPRRAVLDAHRGAGGGFTATDLRAPGQAPGFRGMEGNFRGQGMGGRQEGQRGGDRGQQRDRGMGTQRGQGMQDLPPGPDGGGRGGGR